MFRKPLFALCLMATLACFTAEPIEYGKCGSDVSTNCNITAVHLDPCPEAEKKEPCKVHKGSTGLLQVDFLPGFSSDTLTAGLYWVNSFNIDLPLPGMNTNACDTTICPTVSGHEQTYTYNLTIKKYFPRGKYNVKWLLTGSDKANEKCCFEFTIKLL